MKRGDWIVASLVFFTKLACADGEIRIYGVADLTFESVRTTGATAPGANQPKRQRVSNNSSLIGFKGTEDLGGGLQAIFQVESATNMDAGTGSFSTRDTFVGMKGGLGTIKAGFMTGPMRALGGKLNFIPGSTSIANNIGLMTNLNGRALGFNSRIANSLIYETPKLQGFGATFAYGADENKTSTKGDPIYGFGMEYINGPAYIGYAYEKRKDKEVLATAPSADTNHRIAFRYTFGATRISLGFDREKSEGKFGAGAGSESRDAYSIGVSHVVGPHEYPIHYADARRLKCTGAAITGECAPANVRDTGAKQLSLAYHYFFSKRTMLQAYLVRINNDAQAKYDFDTNPVVNAFASRAAGADPTGIGIGLRYTF